MPPSFQVSICAKAKLHQPCVRLSNLHGLFNTGQTGMLPLRAGLRQGSPPHEKHGSKDRQLFSLQKKELMLAQLRSELCVSDDRHLELRQAVSEGEDQPWLK